MNPVKLLTILVLNAFLLCAVPQSAFAQNSTQQQTTQFALQRGYRTGYSDGYMAGYRDTIDGNARSYTRHAEYSKADRAYSQDYGSLADFRDGYQQGFEAGYDTGFERRSFEATLPSRLDRRGVIVGDRQNLATNQAAEIKTVAATSPETIKIDNTTPVAITQIESTYSSDSTATILIPRDTELVLELNDDLSTEQSREGDKFTARIVAPSEIAGAIVEGRVSKIQSSGRIKRRSELSLTFDRIVLSETRWTNFGATLIEVMPVKGDNIKTVDVEGTALGQSSLKGDAVKVGGSAGAGALVGGVVGGPVGAAVGASVGAAFGVGAVVIERGKQIRLNRNQQMRIKTSYETQIR